MEELDFDQWFFCLPACQQMDITGIYFNEDTAIDETYDAFDNAVADWWDELDYEDKRYIYERVELGL
jgi:hypothetical protein